MMVPFAKTRFCSTWLLLAAVAAIACQSRPAPPAERGEPARDPSPGTVTDTSQGCGANPQLSVDRETTVHVLPAGIEKRLRPGERMEVTPGVVQLRFGQGDDVSHTMVAVLPGEVHLFELQPMGQQVVHKAKSTCRRSSLPDTNFDVALEGGLLSSDGAHVAHVQYEWSALNGIEDISIVVESVASGATVRKWSPGINTSSGPPTFDTAALSEASKWIRDGKYQREGVRLSEDAVSVNAGRLRVRWGEHQGAAALAPKSAQEKACCKGDFHVSEVIAVKRAQLAIVGGNYSCSYESRGCAAYHPEEPQELLRYFVNL